MRESARIYDVRMAQFVLKIEKLSHIIGARESRDLRSPSPIMAPGFIPFSWNVVFYMSVSGSSFATSERINKSL